MDDWLPDDPPLEAEVTVYAPLRFHPSDLAIALLEIPIGLARGVKKAFESLQNSACMHANWRIGQDKKQEEAADLERLTLAGLANLPTKEPER